MKHRQSDAMLKEYYFSIYAVIMKIHTQTYSIGKEYWYDYAEIFTYYEQIPLEYNVKLSVFIIKKKEKNLCNNHTIYIIHEDRTKPVTYIILDMQCI